MSVVERLAGDIICKCVAKGTVGNMYVNIDMCKRSFNKEDQGYLIEALTFMANRGFIQYHKHGTCFGLEPTRYKEAVEFALTHAGEKRRAVLAMRDPQAPFLVEQTTWVEEEAEPELVTRGVLVEALHAYLPESLFRREVAALRQEIHARPQHIAPAGPAMDSVGLEELRAMVQAGENRIMAMRELVDSLKRTVDLHGVSLAKIVVKDPRVDGLVAELKRIEDLGVTYGLTIQRTDRRRIDALIDMRLKAAREEVIQKTNDWFKVNADATVCAIDETMRSVLKGMEIRDHCGRKMEVVVGFKEDEQSPAEAVKPS